METHGALVGWTHHDIGDKIMLKIESVQTTAAAADHDPDIFRVLMTRNQAAILGQYLIRSSGLTPAEPGKGWLRRLFGQLRAGRAGPSLRRNARYMRRAPAGA